MKSKFKLNLTFSPLSRTIIILAVAISAALIGGVKYQDFNQSTETPHQTFNNFQPIVNLPSPIPTSTPKQVLGIRPSPTPPPEMVRLKTFDKKEVTVEKSKLVLLVWIDGKTYLVLPEDVEKYKNWAQEILKQQANNQAAIAYFKTLQNYINTLKETWRVQDETNRLATEKYYQNQLQQSLEGLKNIPISTAQPIQIQPLPNYNLGTYKCYSGWSEYWKAHPGKGPGPAGVYGPLYIPEPPPCEFIPN